MKKNKEENMAKKFTIIVVIAIVLTALITAVIVKKFMRDDTARQLTPTQKENIEKVGQDLKEYYMNKYK